MCKLRAERRRASLHAACTTFFLGCSPGPPLRLLNPYPSFYVRPSYPLLIEVRATFFTAHSRPETEKLAAGWVKSARAALTLRLPCTVDGKSELHQTHAKLLHRYSRSKHSRCVTTWYFVRKPSPLLSSSSSLFVLSREGQLVAGAALLLRPPA